MVHNVTVKIAPKYSDYMPIDLIGIDIGLVNWKKAQFEFNHLPKLLTYHHELRYYF